MSVHSELVSMMSMANRVRANTFVQ
jgi:hypothetical protein